MFKKYYIFGQPKEKDDNFISNIKISIRFYNFLDI